FYRLARGAGRGAGDAGSGERDEKIAREATEGLIAALARLADARAARGETLEAVAALRESLDLRDEPATRARLGALQRGRLYAEMERAASAPDPAAFEKAAAQALFLAPSDEERAHGELLRARMELASGRPAQARARLAALLEKGPRGEVFRLTAECHIAEGSLADAAAACRAGLAEADQSFAPLVLLFDRLHRQLGAPPGAEVLTRDVGWRLFASDGFNEAPFDEAARPSPRRVFLADGAGVDLTLAGLDAAAGRIEAIEARPLGAPGRTAGPARLPPDAVIPVGKGCLRIESITPGVERVSERDLAGERTWRQITARVRLFGDVATLDDRDPPGALPKIAPPGVRVLSAARGAPLPGALVEVRSAWFPPGRTASALTDSFGRAPLPPLLLEVPGAGAPLLYDLVVTRDHYPPARIEAIALPAAGEREPLVVTLTPRFRMARPVVEVTDARTGRPVSGAVGRMRTSVRPWNGWVEARVGDDGMLRFDALPIDAEGEVERVTHELVVEHPAYMTFSSVEPATSAEAAGGARRAALIPADARRTLLVSVVDAATGAPVAGALVTLTPAAAAGAPRRANTAGDGVARMERVVDYDAERGAAAVYALRVEKRGYESHDATGVSAAAGDLRVALRPSAGR
ncbi:MAG: carboxypeptidase regulatory-like domain-containing protein, partial [Planctomycetes bacterium]|nr:carboxypeptidase regulatory-like domain-containing protein [Planctomycetota bacterium]